MIKPAVSRVIVITLVLALGGTARAEADADFMEWVSDFRGAANAAGVSSATYARAFRNVTAPDAEVIKLAKFQPEFVSPPWEYFDNRIHEQSVQTGRDKAREWQPWLDKIEKRFGVDRHILLAIWSVESKYGEVLTDDKVMRNVIRSLATLAYADPKRRKFARTQLIAALKILQHGDIDESHLTGSWAGAMGHTQFIPTSYQAYAIDMDGDGKRDIWSSVPDALATAANLLSKNGWRSGQSWGREVEDGEFAPDGDDGPSFDLHHNFRVLKRYNNADKYALAVGLLADQIAGRKPLSKDWDRPFTKLSFAEKQELQRLLQARGFYDGEVDGKTGPKSREAIRRYQASIGVEEDGYPSKETLDRLRRKR